MKFVQLLDAQDALLALAKQPLAVKEAVALSRLLKQIAEEGKIFNEQQMIIRDGDGSKEEKEEMANQLLEIEMKLENVPVEIESAKNISAHDVHVLEGFVNFIC